MDRYILIYIYTQPSTCKCSYCIKKKLIKNYENEVIDIIKCFLIWNVNTNSEWLEMRIHNFTTKQK